MNFPQQKNVYFYNTDIRIPSVSDSSPSFSEIKKMVPCKWLFGMLKGLLFSFPFGKKMSIAE